MSLPRIITHYWAKPIPLRQFDWQAHYDGDEPNDAGGMDHGSGRTEALAVLDLITNHPRHPVECERDRNCGNCTHYREISNPQHDDPYRTDFRCARFGYFTYSHQRCDNHFFAGGEPQCKSSPIVDEVPF